MLVAEKKTPKTVTSLRSFSFCDDFSRLKNTQLCLALLEIPHHTTYVPIYNDFACIVTTHHNFFPVTICPDGRSDHLSLDQAALLYKD